MSSIEQRQATLHDLSFALRHPETWPKDFDWNYADCNRCAMGLAHRMWPKQVPEPTTNAMMDAFGMNTSQASDIFTGAGRQYYTNLGVKPSRIADLIDELV